MKPYEHLAASAGVYGMPIIAILDPDGHMAVCPIAVGLLEDEPAKGLVVEAFSDLLEARLISKRRGAPE